MISLSRNTDAAADTANTTIGSLTLLDNTAAARNANWSLTPRGAMGGRMKPSVFGDFRKPLLALLSGVIFVIATPLHGETDRALESCLSGPNAGQSAGMNDCIVRAAEEWSRRMDSAYQRLITKLDPTSRSLLEASQESWETYRTKELAFAHGPWRQYGGTFEQLDIAELRLEELQNRTLTLEGYLKGE